MSMSMSDEGSGPSTESLQIPFGLTCNRSKHGEKDDSSTDDAGLEESYNASESSGGSCKGHSSEKPQITKPLEWKDCSIVMVRKLANSVTKQQLEVELRYSGFQDYEFLNLPMGYIGNRGFAFIGFYDKDKAWEFKQRFDGKSFLLFGEGKKLMVLPADVTRTNVRDPIEPSHGHRTNPNTLEHKKMERAARKKHSLIDMANHQWIEQAALSAQMWRMTDGSMQNCFDAMSMMNCSMQEYSEASYMSSLSAPSPQPSSVALSAPMKLCPGCCTATRDKWNFCASCGACLTWEKDKGPESSSATLDLHLYSSFDRSKLFDVPASTSMQMTGA